MKSSLSRRNIFIKVALGCVGFFLAAYLMRHLIFASLVQYAVSSTFDEKLEYQSRKWEEGVLVYDDIKIGDQIQSPQLRLTPSLKFFPFHVSVEIYFNEPRFNLCSGTPARFSLVPFVSTRWSSLRLDIERGELRIDQELIGALDFISGTNVESIGKLIVVSDEPHSYCSLELLHQDAQFFYHLNLDQTPALHVQSILTLFDIRPLFQLQGGKVGADVKGSFSLKGSWDYTGEVSGIDVQLVAYGGEYDFHHIRLRSEGTHQSLISLEGTVEGGRFQNDFLSIEEAQGMISMEGHQPSKMSLKGSLSYEGITAPFACNAAGNITSEEAKNLEGVFEWHRIQFPFSYAQNHSSTVLHAELENIPLPLCCKSFESLSPQWIADAGTISASVAAYFDYYALISLELREIEAKEIKLSQKQLSLDSIRGEVMVRCSSGKMEGEVKALATLPLKNCPESVVDVAFQLDNNALTWKGSLELANNRVDIQGVGDLKSHVWKGSFQSPSIDLAHFCPYLPESILVEGKVSVRGEINASEARATLQGSDLLFQTPSLLYRVEGMTPSLEVKRLFESLETTASLELPPATLYLKEIAAPIHVEGGSAVWKEGVLEVSNLQACLEEAVFQGRLKYLHADTTIEVVSERLEGSLSDLSILQNVVKGRFVCGKDDFKMKIDLKERIPQIQAKAHIDTLSYQLTNQIQLEHGSCELNYCSMEKAFSLTEGTASLVLPHRQLMVQIPTIQGKGDQYVFSGAIPSEQIALAGSIDLKDKTVVRIDQGLIGQSLLQEILFFIKDHNQWSVQGKAALALISLPHYVSLLQEAGFCKEIHIPVMEGELTIKGHLTPQASSLDIQSPGIVLSSFSIPAIRGHIEQQESVWLIEELLIGEMSLQAEVLKTADLHWQIRKWSMASKELRLQGAAQFKQGIWTARGSGTWKEKTSIKGELNWNIDTQEGSNNSLQLQQGSLNVNLICPLLQLSEKKLVASSIQTTIEHPALKESIQAPLSLSFSAERVLLQGPFTQGLYESGFFKLKGSEIQAMVEKGVFHFQTKLQMNGIPIKAKGYFLPLEGGKGDVQLFEGNDTLRLSFSAYDTVTRVEGRLLGVDCSLQREGEIFKGDLKLQSSDRLSFVLQKPEWNQFENLGFSGTIRPATGSFKGTLEGKEAVVQGFAFNSLQAWVDYQPTQFEIRQLKIDDEAGHFLVKECYGHRSHHLKAWDITIPHVRGQQVQPSLLRKQGQTRPQPKPFQVRQMTLTQISGTVGRPLTFRGLGSFYFTQKEKRDPSLFDLPRSFLKEWGLDIALLSPIHGVCDIELSQGKVMFKALKESYSEGGHSEFFLSESEPSYIDLKGGLFLNLRVKQNVMLKLAEPFTLSIRGTWEKPLYTLR